MIRTLHRSGPPLPAICLVLGITASLVAQGPDRGVVIAPVGRSGERVQLYSGSYALLVGVSQYDVTVPWSPLSSIPGELADVEAVLRESGFSTIEKLNNPTGDQIRTGVRAFIRKFGYLPGARLVFFFAGHGYTLDNGDRGYFVPRDAPNPKVDDPGFRSTAISMQSVLDWAQDITALHALFVFDSCFSGSIFRTRSASVPDRISALTSQKVRQFLSAGDAFQAVPARSVFVPVFVRALRGAADYDRDGYVTGKELGAYVMNEVLEYRTGQTPQFGPIRDPRLDQGDVVFAVPAPAAIAPGLDPAVALRDGIARYRSGDYAAAYPLLLRAGTAGQTSAAFYLGYLFSNGLGVAPDYTRAREWYQISAAAGNAAAMNNLGTIYGAGRLGPADATAAITWYRRAAAGGDLFAMTNLGLCYEDGRGVTADKATAVMWYKRAAFRGHAQAVKALEGLGETAAVRWATADLDLALKTGLDVYRKGQRAEAFDPLLRAALGNRTEAMFYVGFLYHTGTGTPQDRADARAWYEKSAATGVAVAMSNLGLLYEMGQGGPLDLAVAREWYQKAADGGSAAGMRNLGYLYEEGKGVTRDVGTALQWYRRAAALKDEDAIKALARLEQTVTPPPQATRGGAGSVPPPPPVMAPTTIEFESFFAVGNSGTRFGLQGTLTVGAGRIEFRETRAATGRAVNSFSVTCAQMLAVRNETEDDGRIALRVEVKGETYKLYSAVNARRALSVIFDACRSR